MLINILNLASTNSMQNDTNSTKHAFYKDKSTLIKTTVNTEK